MVSSSFIIRQFLLSSVLFSSFYFCSAMKFSRAMVRPLPSVGRYYNPWKYVPFSRLPRSMQRRFMWKDVDDTVDGLMDGARAMTDVFNPAMVRYRKPVEYDSQPSSKVKYVIKKHLSIPPFKRMKIIKFHTPKNPVPHFNHNPVFEPPFTIPLVPSVKPNIIIPFMSEEELRKIEKEQEKRVESEMRGETHEHSHQTHVDDDVISGKIKEFGEEWLPMKGPFSTSKSFPVSQLHTQIHSETTLPVPSALPLIRSKPKDNRFLFEVTEHSAEASVKKEQTFQPPNLLDFFATTTVDKPNYPESFLKSMTKKDDYVKPKKISKTTTSATVITTSTAPSRRLPPRSTTEHPFKRYNLHRPKSSKLFFKRPTTSIEPAKQTQTATTTEQNIKITTELEEPIRATRESIRTTREPIGATTTRAPSAETPPERKRRTRNDSDNVSVSDAQSKIRMKTASQNESSNKTLKRQRGTVKFGAKLS